jgi:hypothetical protein
MVSLTPVLLIVTAAIIALTAFYVIRKNKTVAVVAPAVVEAPVTVEEPKEVQLEQATIYDDKVLEDDVHAAFPNMAGDDTEAQFAQAYTYENLQDSLLTSGKESREAVKSRSAYSRLGARGDMAQWSENMEAIKSEILASGQSLESFMENSWMPIPEQMAAFWKDSDAYVSEPSVPIVAPLPRHAQAEAADLIRDATQDIPSKTAGLRMKEIVDARKRAKSLGLALPELTKQQKTAVAKFLSDDALSGLARTLQSL